MRDVRRLFSIGFPIGSMLVFLGVAIASPAFYRAHVRKHEIGWQEQGTIFCLAPAIVLGLRILSRSRELKTWLVRAWIVLLTGGSIYYAGEECSWGQNYFGWSTPEAWSQINDQHETNLHNTSGLFDHAPRALLSVAAGFCVICPFVARRQQRDWSRQDRVIAWLLPTQAVVPAAALALLSGLPQKVHGQYDKTGEVGNWFAEMFLAGRHSEMKEYFLAMFILMYVWSFAVRLQSMGSAKRTDEPRGRALTQLPKFGMVRNRLAGTHGVGVQEPLGPFRA